MTTDLPLPLGTKVFPWGTIGAVSYGNGERYYMFTRSGGKEVSLMPADVVERAHREQSK